MGVRNFRLLGASTLETVRARAAAAVAAWAAQWGVGLDACEVRCARPGGELAGVAWDGAWHAGPRQCWLELPAALQPALQHAMFGREASHAGAAAAPGQLARLAAARAGAALGAALAGALLGEDGGQPAQPDVAAPPAPQLLARGAGSLCVTLAIGAASARILLDSASVAALAPPAPAARPALAPLKLFKVLAPTPVRLPVRLGQAELGLGALMSVAVGDVIRLERAADAPVEVLGPHGGALFRAYLGQTQGMVAIDIDGRP
jgi:flagellar motor switch/type III secretory pathway protein FliN